MAKLQLCYYPDVVLRQKAQKVVKFDQRLNTLAKEMLLVMEAAKGVGLAGNQVGVSERIVVIGAIPEILTEPLILINPEITKRKGRITAEEGCLSLPGVSAEVPRSLELEAVFYGLSGQRLKIEARGVLARVIQHETDHLDGILYPDRISFLSRQRLWREYQQLIGSGQKEKTP